MTDEPPRRPLREPPGGWDDWEPAKGTWDRADWKLFLVTFAGTMAANLGTVLAVAVAVILVRQPGGKHVPVDQVVIFVVAAFMGISGVTLGLTLFRRIGPPLRPPTWVFRLYFAITAALVLISVLVLLGLASGIK
jgi:hypothetical protein